MNELHEISGTVQRILFRNQENGYSVCSVQTRLMVQPITATGYLANVHEGESITAQGSWIQHAKFGKQFTITSFTTTVPTTLTGLKAYLSSGLIKGIGPIYAAKLIDHFGMHVLQVIDTTPDRLQEVAGIGATRAGTITQAWQEQKEIAHIMVFLQGKGISATYATKMYKKYGHQTLAIVQENPYRLAEEIWGIGFKTADSIAQSMGIEPNSIKRIRAGIIHVITSAVQQGDVYCELEGLRELTAQLLEIDLESSKELIKQALYDLHEHQKIKVVTVENHKHYITLAWLYACEKGIAQKIHAIQRYTKQSLPIDLEKAYALLRNTHSTHRIVLHEQQQLGVMACLQHKITIITGGPGTGKTTLIKTLLNILDEQKIVYKLAAPTGRAAKRITESTGRSAVTIHRLLEFDPATRSFNHNEQNALKLAMLIIDESSMIDLFLGHAIVRALPVHAHIVFIGDIDQLPSVGAGNFLTDLIHSNTIATVRLTTIFRQAQDSLIITNAHRINQGEFPINQDHGARHDYRFIYEDDPARLPYHLQMIFKKTLPTYGITPRDAMILTPMNRGMAGTYTLNQQAQQLLNPTKDKEHIIYGPTLLSIDDPVMQMKNNYDKVVFNGDIGIITAINQSNKQCTVTFGQQQVMYDFCELDELSLAYAATIHKSQGSEYSAVIVPLFMQHCMLLRRNLIYTAITRAKKLCIFIGESKALAIAIGNKQDATRITLLRNFLTSDLTCH